MEDNELIASFEPKLKGWVLVLAFDDLEEMLLEQERIQSLHRQERDDEGAPLPQVEALWMGQSQFGQRSMMANQIRMGVLIASEAGLKEVAEARRAWAQSRMQATSMLPAQQGRSEAWHPSVEQIDMLEKWAAECLEPHPAGGEEWTPRIKTHIAREGFNWYCVDHKRPDLQLLGTSGGRAFSGAIQSLFPKVAIARRGETGNNVYIHGLKRRDGVNPKYFRRT
jgi:hypothetical protein